MKLINSGEWEVVNISFEHVVRMNCFEAINRKCIHEKISRFHSGCGCWNSLQNILCLRLLSKAQDIKVHKTILAVYVCEKFDPSLHGGGGHRFRFLRTWRQGNISIRGNKMKEEERSDSACTLCYYSLDQKGSEMGGNSSSNGEMKIAYCILVLKPERKRPLRRCRHI
jgi:hypothetical protein